MTMMVLKLIIILQFHSNRNEKISKPMCSLPTNCIKPMYAKEGSLENSIGHVLLEKKKRFNCCILFGELIYAYITCRPDIEYAVTSLSKFSLTPTEYHYSLSKGVAIYLKNYHWIGNLILLHQTITTS